MSRITSKILAVAVAVAVALPLGARAQLGPFPWGQGNNGGGGGGGGGNMSGSGATTTGNLLQSGNTGATLNSATDSGIPASSVVTTTGGVTVPNLTLPNPTITGTVAGSPSASGTWGFGAISIGSGVLTGLSNPSGASDAANKAYVDALVGTSTTWHTAVTVATAAVLPNTPTYSNGASGVGATLTSATNTALTVDGQSVTVVGTRVLVQTQASALQNGIYTLTQAGTGSVPWILTRASDFDTAAPGEVALGAAVLATTGTANTGLQFWMNQSAAITIGTTAITWVQIGGSGLVAGTGINISGNAINLNTTLPSGLTIPSAALTSPTIGGHTITLGGNISFPAAPGSTSCLQMSAAGAVTAASAGCMPSIGLGTGLTNTIGTQNTGSQSVTTASPTLYPQNWVTAFTSGHTVSLADGIQTYVANGSGAITFTLGSTANDGAAGVGYCFVDKSGHGFTISIAEPVGGTFYGGGSSGSNFTAGAGKGAYVCTSSDGTNVALGVSYPTASSVAGSAGNPQYNAGGGFGAQPAIIVAAAMPGADECAKISAAAQALPAFGGIVDDRGSNGTVTCSGDSMFDSWPICATLSATSGCSITLLLGPATYIQDYSWQVPKHTTVRGIGQVGSIGPRTYLQISNNFLTAEPSAPALSCGAGSSSFFEISYGNSHDESTPSGETTCNATTSITVTAPSSGTCTAAHATVYYVYASTVSGAEKLQNAGGTACGTNYTAATITTSGNLAALAMPVVALGPAPYTASGASAWFGVQIENVVSDCTNPSGTRETNLTGFLNVNAQQGSWWQHVAAAGCEVSFDVETSNAQNSGPYEDLVDANTSAQDSAHVCMYIGHNSSGTLLNSEFRMISCGGNGSSEAPFGIYLDAQSVYLHGLDLERSRSMIEVGAAHGAVGSTISGAVCGAGLVTTCIDLHAGTNSHAVALSGINDQVASTSAVVDNNAGTNCGTVAAPAEISLYVHSNAAAGQQTGCLSY